MKHHLRKASAYIVPLAMGLATVLQATPSSASTPSVSVAEAIQSVLDPNISATAAEGVVDQLKTAAEAGDAEALGALGFCYANGRGVTQDDAEARKFFEQAANHGSIAGKANLGLFLIHGRGGEKEVKRGVSLMEEAANAGNLESHTFLGQVYYFGLHDDGKPDYHKAYEHLLPAAEKDHAASQNMIGVIFKDGLAGKVDTDAARVWLEKAAFNGNGKACFNLSELWNPNAEDRWARIEAIRWLIVGDKLGEITATYLLEDIRDTMPADELAVAQDLAETTSRRLRVNP
jgi:TPR repeat protein